ncbi:hypothetical protein [Microtetraspora malaysiensis]
MVLTARKASRDREVPKGLPARRATLARRGREESRATVATLALV